MGNPVIASKILREEPSPNIKNERAIDLDVWLARIFLIVVFGAGLVTHLFAFAPGDLALPPCPIHSLTGIPCPGCGMTRACIALASGDFGNALHYNPFSLGLILFALGFALFPQRIRRQWQRLSPAFRASTAWSLLALVIGFWAYKLLP